jgi:hypothetical protein
MGGPSGGGLVSLIMQGLGAKSRLALGRCCRSLLNVLGTPFAWKHCPPLYFRSKFYLRTPLPMSLHTTKHMPLWLHCPFYTQDRWLQQLRDIAARTCIVHLLITSDRDMDGWNAHDGLVLSTMLCTSSFRNLTTLRNVPCTTTVASAISALPGLHTIQFDGPARMSQSCLQHLRAAPALTALQLVDPDYFTLMCVAQLSRLNRLHVTRACVRDIGAFCTAVSVTGQFTSLTVVDARYPDDTRVVWTDVEPIASLRIHGSREFAPSLLHAFSRCTSLRTVYIRDWDDETCVHIVMMLKNNPDVRIELVQKPFICDGSDTNSCTAFYDLMKRFPQRVQLV